jgi:hypothetical protein
VADGVVGGLSPRTRHAGYGLRRAAAVLVCCAAAAAAAITVEPGPKTVVDIDLRAASALIMTGTNMHVVDSAWMDMAVRNYIQPTLGGDYTEIPVTTPAQFWPFTGSEDMYFDLSVLGGTDVIGEAITAQHNPAVVFGYSQSAVIATAAKRRLADSAASGASTPEVSFVMLANLNRPNGGLNARFTGAFIEKLGWTFSAAAPTNTSFTTIDVARQYDLFADFPSYPLNIFADANAVVALFYGAHDYSRVSLNPGDAGYHPNTVAQQWGDTTYYFIPTEQLPLLRPLRDLGANPLLMDALEPAMRVLVEAGYDRSTPFGQPTQAQLIPRDDFERVKEELNAAIEQGRAMWEAANPPVTTSGTATPTASEVDHPAPTDSVGSGDSGPSVRDGITSVTEPPRVSARRSPAVSRADDTGTNRAAPRSRAR